MNFQDERELGRLTEAQLVELMVAAGRLLARAAARPNPPANFLANKAHGVIVIYAAGPAIPHVERMLAGLRDAHGGILRELPDP